MVLPANHYAVEASFSPKLTLAGWALTYATAEDGDVANNRR